MTTTSGHPTPTLYALPAGTVDALPWQPFPGGHGIEHKPIFHGDNQAAGLLRFRPGGYESAHLHLHGEHHIWVLSGELTVDDTALPTGSYLHVPGRLAHRLVDAGGGSVVFYVFNPSGEEQGGGR